VSADKPDLDGARALLDAPVDVLARVFEKAEELWRHRRIDPELRADILRVAERVDPVLAEQLERELDTMLPAAVLAGHEAELIEDSPAFGAFPCSDSFTAPSIEAWLVEDPRRLRGVTLEACRFTPDDRLVAEGVLSLAESLGIELRQAGEIVASALRDARYPQAVAR
jgi:hypothetical protein